MMNETHDSAGLDEAAVQDIPTNRLGHRRQGRSCLCTWPECYAMQKQLMKRTEDDANHPHALFTGFIRVTNIFRLNTPKHVAFRRMLHSCFACNPHEQEQPDDDDDENNASAKQNSDHHATAHCTQHLVCWVPRLASRPGNKAFLMKRHDIARHHYTQEQLEFIYKLLDPEPFSGRGNYPTLPVDREAAESSSIYFREDADIAHDGVHYFLSPRVPREVALEHFYEAPEKPPDAEDDEDEVQIEEHEISAPEPVDHTPPPLSVAGIVPALERLIDAQDEFFQHWQEAMTEFQQELLHVQEILAPYVPAPPPAPEEEQHPSEETGELALTAEPAETPDAAATAQAAPLALPWQDAASLQQHPLLTFFQQRQQPFQQQHISQLQPQEPGAPHVQQLQAWMVQQQYQQQQQQQQLVQLQSPDAGGLAGWLSQAPQFQAFLQQQQIQEVPQQQFWQLHHQQEQLQLQLVQIQQQLQLLQQLPQQDQLAQQLFLHLQQQLLQLQQQAQIQQQQFFQQVPQQEQLTQEQVVLLIQLQQLQELLQQQQQQGPSQQQQQQQLIEQVPQPLPTPYVVDLTVPATEAAREPQQPDEGSPSVEEVHTGDGYVTGSQLQDIHQSHNGNKAHEQPDPAAEKHDRDDMSQSMEGGSTRVRQGPQSQEGQDSREGSKRSDVEDRREQQGPAWEQGKELQEGPQELLDDRKRSEQEEMHPQQQEEGQPPQGQPHAEVVQQREGGYKQSLAGQQSNEMGVTNGDEGKQDEKKQPVDQRLKAGEESPSKLEPHSKERNELEGGLHPDERKKPDERSQQIEVLEVHGEQQPTVVATSVGHEQGPESSVTETTSETTEASVAQAVEAVTAQVMPTEPQRQSTTTMTAPPLSPPEHIVLPTVPVLNHPSQVDFALFQQQQQQLQQQIIQPQPPHPPNVLETLQLLQALRMLQQHQQQQLMVSQGQFVDHGWLMSQEQLLLQHNFVSPPAPRPQHVDQPRDLSGPLAQFAQQPQQQEFQTQPQVAQLGPNMADLVVRLTQAAQHQQLQEQWLQQQQWLQAQLLSPSQQLVAEAPALIDLTTNSTEPTQQQQQQNAEQRLQPVEGQQTANEKESQPLRRPVAQWEQQTTGGQHAKDVPQSEKGKPSQQKGAEAQEGQALAEGSEQREKGQEMVLALDKVTYHPEGGRPLVREEQEPQIAQEKGRAGQPRDKKERQAKANLKLKQVELQPDDRHKVLRAEQQRHGAVVVQPLGEEGPRTDGAPQRHERARLVQGSSNEMEQALNRQRQDGRQQSNGGNHESDSVQGKPIDNSEEQRNISSRMSLGDACQWHTRIQRCAEDSSNGNTKRKAHSVGKVNKDSADHENIQDHSFADSIQKRHRPLMPG